MIKNIVDPIQIPPLRFLPALLESRRGGACRAKQKQKRLASGMGARPHLYVLSAAPLGSDRQALDLPPNMEVLQNKTAKEPWGLEVISIRPKFFFIKTILYICIYVQHV